VESARKSPSGRRRPASKSERHRCAIPGLSGRRLHDSALKLVHGERAYLYRPDPVCYYVFARESDYPTSLSLYFCISIIPIDVIYDYVYLESQGRANTESEGREGNSASKSVPYRMKSGGFLTRRAPLRRKQPHHRPACRSIQRGRTCFREALRAHSTFVVAQQAFALDAPRDRVLPKLVPTRELACESRHWLRSHSRQKSSSLGPVARAARGSLPSVQLGGRQGSQPSGTPPAPRRTRLRIDGHQVVCVHDW